MREVRSKGKTKEEGSIAASRRALSMRKAIIVLTVAALCLVGVMAGCQPKASNEAAEGATAEQQDVAKESKSVATPGTFEVADSGVWPDSQYTQSMNAGNRGCNSCHADLFSVLPEGEVGSHEVYKEAGYGRVYTYNDCVTCHVGVGSDGAASGGAGMFMATTIHGYHYGNQEFLDKGNCFSCHEADVNTGMLGMWDILKYSKYIGLGTSAPGTDTWIQGRGYASGTVTGGVVEADMALKNVETNQDPSSPDDLYGATNMDFPDINQESYTVTIKGVANERTFTLDELRSLPQTTTTFTEICGTNGANGGFFVTNIEATGVRLSTLIEECGGLLDGTTCFGSLGYDGWAGPFTPNPTRYPMNLLDEDAMVALQYWGQDIDEFDGGPALFVVPGTVAFTNSKWVEEITFFQGECPDAISTIADWGMFTNSAGWFSPAIDGETFKVGETVKLEGYAFSLPEQGLNSIESIQISADYGETWTTIEVPADYDENQWTRFSAEWVPQKAGTYCLTVHCDGVSTATPANDGKVLVTVTE